MNRRLCFFSLFSGCCCSYLSLLLLVLFLILGLCIFLLLESALLPPKGILITNFLWTDSYNHLTRARARDNTITPHNTTPRIDCDISITNDFFFPFIFVSAFFRLLFCSNKTSNFSKPFHSLNDVKNTMQSIAKHTHIYT